MDRRIVKELVDLGILPYEKISKDDYDLGISSGDGYTYFTSTGFADGSTHYERADESSMSFEDIIISLELKKLSHIRSIKRMFMFTAVPAFLMFIFFSILIML